ncbi:YgjV family protein [Candidatus Saccharibacteria bacterium]|nr:YgjV family protein [Candidatus Saccharibacteria bacterium]
MDIFFFLAQISAVAGWMFLILSYYRDDIKKLLKMQIVACALETLSYLLLGAWAGLFACLLDLAKAILYYKVDRKEIIFYATLPFYVVLAVFALQSEGWISLLPTIGGIIDGFVLTRNKTVATVGSIVASSLWVIYDIVVMAYAAAVSDSILIISNFFVLFLGYSRILHINRLHIIKCYYLTKSISANIIRLDKDNYSEQYLWDIDKQKTIFKINPDSIVLIRDKKHTVGYVNYLTITEDCYERIRRAQTFYKDIRPEDITTMRRHRRNYLLLESVCVSKSYESQKMADFINRHFRNFLRNKHRLGYNFYGIESIAVSDFEKLFLETADFANIKTYREGEILFELDDIAVAKYIR